MGIPTRVIKLFSKILKNKNLSGTVLTYGVQGIQGQYSEILNILKKAKYNYKEIPSNRIILDNNTQYGNTIHQSILFETLGFSNSESLDFYNNENPTHIIDLNNPLPEKFWGQYDLIYDGGTMEHCFDVRQVLTNTVKFLKVGGYIIHVNPISGWINHGFYQFSPTLYFDFYSINGFDDLEMKILINDNYFIDFNNNWLPSDFSGEKAILVFIARKVQDLEKINNPIQSSYKSMFGEMQSHNRHNKITSLKNMLSKNYIFKEIIYLRILSKIPKTWINYCLLLGQLKKL